MAANNWLFGANRNKETNKQVKIIVQTLLVFCAFFPGFHDIAQIKTTSFTRPMHCNGTWLKLKSTHYLI